VLVVRRRPHEGQRDEVGAEAEGPAQVLLVLLGQGGHAHRHAGQVEALVVRHGAADLDARVHVVALDARDAHGHAAVVDEDAVPRAGVARQALVRRRRALLGAEHVVGRDGELVALGELHLPVALEPAEPDLRALEVHQHGDRPARGLRRRAHVADDRLVLLGGAVTAVDPGDVHPGVDQGLDLLRRLGRGTRGADDLRSTHDSSLLPGPTTHRSQGALDPGGTCSACRGRRDAASDHVRYGRIGRVSGPTGAGSSEPRRTGAPSSGTTARSPPARRYASTAAATARPSAMAQTTSDWPRPASPATKTPGTEVAKSSPRAMRPRPVTSAPVCSASASVSGPTKPIARMTRSAGMSRTSSPGIRAPSGV